MPTYGWTQDPGSVDHTLFDDVQTFVETQYCTDDVFAYGRSDGGAMATAIARDHAGVTAVASATGWLYDGVGPAWPAAYVEPGYRVPIRVSHNADDATVAVANARTNCSYWNGQNEIPSTAPVDCTTGGVPSSYDVSDTCRRFERAGGDVIYCENPTGGHWPLIEDATAIWSFFSEHM